jgi:hypothetical protein
MCHGSMTPVTENDDPGTAGATRARGEHLLALFGAQAQRRHPMLPTCQTRHHSTPVTRTAGQRVQSRSPGFCTRAPHPGPLPRRGEGRGGSPQKRTTRGA